LPVDAQQPPLHAVSAELPHVVEHTPVAVSHAMPLGQSVDLVQPEASGCASGAASGPASGAGASAVVASRACASTAASSGGGASKLGLPPSGNAASSSGGVELPNLQATRPAHKSAIVKGSQPPHTLPMASM
jgi:hypothetical protein